MTALTFITKINYRKQRWGHYDFNALQISLKRLHVLPIWLCRVSIKTYNRKRNQRPLDKNRREFRTLIFALCLQFNCLCLLKLRLVTKEDIQNPPNSQRLP